LTRSYQAPTISVASDTVAVNPLKLLIAIPALD